MEGIEFVKRYNKVREVIKSSSTIGHVKTSNIMINNLLDLCMHDEMNPQAYLPFILELRELLRTKIDENEDYILQQVS
jgi:hypothetical protein